MYIYIYIYDWPDNNLKGRFLILSNSYIYNVKFEEIDFYHFNLVN